MNLQTERIGQFCKQLKLERVLAEYAAAAQMAVRDEASFTDFLAGARYLLPLNERWRLTFTGDLSAGDTEGSFSLAAYAGYRTGRHHLIGGYRHFEMEVEAGGARRVTETFSGPLVAYGFSF